MLDAFLEEVKDQTSIELVKDKKDSIINLAKTLKHDSDLALLLRGSLCDMTFSLKENKVRRTICTLNEYFITIYMKYINHRTENINVSRIARFRPGSKYLLFYDLIDNGIKSINLNKPWVINDFILFNPQNISALNMFVKNLKSDSMTMNVKNQFKKNHA